MAALSQKQLDEFRLNLAAIKNEIEILLGRTTLEARPVDLDLPIGRLSRADAMQMQNMAQMNQRQLETRLKNINSALTAIDDGTYGRCRGCGDDINTARLEVYPESPFCVDCQEYHDQR